MNIEAIGAILMALSWVLLSDVVILRLVGPSSAGDQPDCFQAPPARPNVDMFLKEGRHDMTTGHGRLKSGMLAPLIGRREEVSGENRQKPQNWYIWIMFFFLSCSVRLSEMLHSQLFDGWCIRA